MKTKEWIVICAAGMMLASGCVDYKKKYLEVDSRANEATKKLNDLTAAMEEQKAEKAKLQELLRQRSDQLAELRVQAIRQTNQLNDEVRTLTDTLARLKNDLSNALTELESTKAKAHQADQLAAKVKELADKNAQLEAEIKRPQAEPNAPSSIGTR